MPRTNGRIVINDAGTSDYVITQGVPTGDSVAAAITAVEAIAQKAFNASQTNISIPDAAVIRSDTATALAQSNSALAQVTAAVTTQDTAVTQLVTTPTSATAKALAVATAATVRKSVVPTKRGAIAKAACYVNFLTGEASSYGVAQAWSDVVTGPAAGSAAPVHPAVDNLAGGTSSSDHHGLVPFAGYATGGTQVPTNSYLRKVSGTDDRVPTVTAASATSLTLQFPTGTGNNWCRWVMGPNSSAGDIFPAGSVLIVSVDVAWSGVLNAGVDKRPFITAIPMRSTDGSIYAANQTQPVITGSDTGRVTFRVQMPSTGGPFTFAFWWQSYDATQAATCTLSNLVYTVAAASEPVALQGTHQPYTTSTTAAQGFSLTLPGGIPDGDYAVLCKMDDRWIAVTRTISGGAGLLTSTQINAVMHSATGVSEVALIPSSSWDSMIFPGLVGSVEGATSAPAYRNVRFFDTGSTTTTTGSVPVSYPDANRPWGYPVGCYQIVAPARTYCLQSLPLVGALRARILPGDRNRLDINGGNANERAEFNRVAGAFAYGTPIWLSVAVRFTGHLVADGDFAIFNQMQQNPGSGLKGQSPPVSFGLIRTAGAEYICCDVRSDNGTPQASSASTTNTWVWDDTTGGTGYTQGAAGSPAHIYQRRPWKTPYVEGAWYQLLACVTFSNSGGGNLQLWCNGTQVFNGAIKIGFNFPTGPTHSTGIYRHAITNPIQMDEQHVHCTTNDLSALATKPHPICDLTGWDAA